MQKNIIQQTRQAIVLLAVFSLFIGYAGITNADGTESSYDDRYVQVTSADEIPYKQLSHVKQIIADGDESIVSFQYDGNGRLSSSKNSDGYTETYSYDEAGRLIEVGNSVWESFGPMYAYRYDQNGFLLEISGIGEGGGGAISFENDSQGRVIREINNSDFGTIDTAYTYNDDGTHVDAVITRVNDFGKTVETVEYDYTFDVQGRILSVTTSGEGYSYCSTYHYDYPLFVLTGDENWMPYRCEIVDCTGRKIWGINLGINPQPIQCDEDGYISRIVCEDQIIEFYYH